MSQPTRSCPVCATPLPGMAAFCYVCGTATPSGIDRATGQRVAMGGDSGITPDDLLKRLQRVLGPGYQIENRIGAGGFAVVYHARDLRLKRDLAIKVLRPDLGLSADIMQRFRREAETIAALRHGHIVPIYDVGEGEGLAFLIMPMIHGESLRATMEREGAMPVEEVKRILREAAMALAAAHDTGMIHRDVKPENIMLEGKDRRALLMDFGIAKAVSKEDGDPGEALTTTGIIIGTPQYMSPEQATGDKRIDARTDQYSLAVVGYRMLSGRLPFEGESTRAVLYQQLVAEPAPLETHIAGIPSSIATTIQRAMSKEPSERFESMRDFAASLDGELVPAAASAAVANEAGKGSAQNSTKPAKGVPVARGKAAAATPFTFAKVQDFIRRPQGMIAAGIGVLALFGIIFFASRPGAASGDAGAATATATNVADGAGATASATGAEATATQPAATTPVAPPPPPPPPPPATTAKPNRGNAAGAAPAVKPGPAKPDPAQPSSTVKVVTNPPPPPAGPNCLKLVGAADWQKAVAACTTEAEGGNVVAQRTLAGMYAKGTGVPEDPGQAANWYRKASATDPEAKLRLSELLIAGKGVKQNTTEGNVLLREAAGLGYVPAEALLASRLETGSNIKKDESESALWYRRAAEKGDKPSEAKLAEFLAKGRGITKDEAEALEWYKKAGDAGIASASWAAAQMYFKGQGTVKNETEGMLWLRKAAQANDPDAVKELKKRGG